MGLKNISGVRKVVRGGKPRWVLDFQFTDQDGVRRRFRRYATVQNYAASLAEAARLMRRAAATGMPEENPMPAASSMTSSSMTYKEFYEGIFEEQFVPNYRPATAARYRALHRQRVLAFFGHKPLNEIDSGDYRSFAAVLRREGIKNKGALSVVRTVLVAAEASGLIGKAPEVPKRLIDHSGKLPDAPSADDVAKMLTTEGWVGTAVALAAYAGMRMGEIRAVEARDIDLDGARLFVRRALSEDVSLTPKNGKERIVPIHPALVERLEQVMRNKFPRARVVLDEHGQTPTRQHVLHVFKQQLARLGLRERSFHSLRHFFVSQLLRQGVGAEVVRELAGHSSLEMTQRYAHSSTEDHRAAIDKLK